MCCAWVITDYQRPFSAVKWRKAHVLAVDRKTIQYTIHAEGQLEALQHCTSRARRASTGSVRLAIALQDLSPAVWSRSCPDTGNQAETAEDRDLIAASFPCDVCGRSCALRIGLDARRRTHLPTWVYCDPRSVVSTAQSTTASEI